MPSFPFFRERPKKHEWVGGRYVFPVDIGEGREAIRPDCIIWLELPDRTLVGSTVIDPQRPATVAESLEEAMLRPVQGPPRRPVRIRVPDEKIANELRRSFRGIPIIVAPVPELDEAFAEVSAMAERDANPSYLDDGATAPAVVEEFFGAARLFFRAAPWHHIDERQLVGVDIPAFEINDACLSVIGGAGETSGLLLFRSLHDVHSFTMRLTPYDDTKADAAVRSVSFDRKKDLPPSLIREIQEHRWPVAGSKAYPTVICLDADRNQLQPVERDFRIMTACTRAFLSFFESIATSSIPMRRRRPVRYSRLAMT